MTDDPATSIRDGVCRQTPPAAPGIYRFHDARGTLLYIGKSRNLRARIRSHLRGGDGGTRAARLQLQAARVSWRETAGELGALLREAAEIKRAMPLHNRRLRRHRSLCVIERHDGLDPARPIRLERLGGGADLCPSALLGVFRNRYQARRLLEGLVREHGLCPRVLGLEPAGQGACFQYQLGRCRGACVGSEALEAHNERLFEALEEAGFRGWPWAGAVAVMESRPGVAEEFHVIREWCHLGSVADLDQARALAGGGPVVAAGFDLDIHRLLSGWFRDPEHRQGVFDLSGAASPGVA